MDGNIGVLDYGLAPDPQNAGTLYFSKLERSSNPPMARRAGTIRPPGRQLSRPGVYNAVLALAVNPKDTAAVYGVTRQLVLSANGGFHYLKTRH